MRERRRGDKGRRDRKEGERRGIQKGRRLPFFFSSFILGGTHINIDLEHQTDTLPVVQVCSDLPGVRCDHNQSSLICICILSPLSHLPTSPPPHLPTSPPPHLPTSPPPHLPTSPPPHLPTSPPPLLRSYTLLLPPPWSPLLLSSSLPPFLPSSPPFPPSSSLLPSSLCFYYLI